MTETTGGPANSGPSPVVVGSAIADNTYRNYDGPLQTHALRWWVVAQATLRQAFSKQKGGFWIIAALIAIAYLAQGIIFFLSKLAEANTGATLLGTDNPYATTFYNAQNSVEFWIFVAALTIGAASIAADNRANALLVYLSKPITRADYLIGKWVGVFILLAALILIPNLLLYVFMIGTYFNEGFKEEAVSLLWKILVGSTLAPAIHTSMILAFSAWSKTPRIAGAIYAAFYLILAFAVNIGAEVLASRDPDNKNPDSIALVRNASLGGVTSGLAMHLYKVTPQQIMMAGDRLGRRRNRPLTEREQQRRMRREENLMRRLAIPPLLPLGILGLVYVGLPLLAAVRKVRAVEVIRG